MPTKPIERLLFAQGGRCFFCEQPLSPSDATVEHLVGRANGGKNSDENCVACCKTLNLLFGRMSMKEKLRIVLNQKGTFICPKGEVEPAISDALPADALDRVLADLRRRGDKCPATVKTLRGTINNMFQKNLSEPQVSRLIGMLEARGIVRINGTKVSYELPASA